MWLEDGQLRSVVQASNRKNIFHKSYGHSQPLRFCVSWRITYFIKLEKYRMSSAIQVMSTSIYIYIRSKSIILYSIHFWGKSVLPYNTTNLYCCRLAVACILKCCRPHFLAMFAIKCSSWTGINQGTSNRSACSAIGHDSYESVSASNSLLERRLEIIFTTR